MNQSNDSSPLEPDSSQPHRYIELLRSFRIAIHPGKLLPALLIVVLLYICGRMLDGLGFGEAVYPGEITQYVQAENSQAFDDWMDKQRSDNALRLVALLQTGGRMEWDDARALVYEKEDETITENLRSDRYHTAYKKLREQFEERLQKIENMDVGDETERDEALQRLQTVRQKVEADFRDLRPQGVFAATLDFKLAALRQVMTRAIDPAILTDAQTRDELVAVATSLVMLPAWLWHAHPVFLALWMVIVLIVWSLLGGAISRMAVLEAARDERITFTEALRFVRKRWASYIAAPLVPPAIVGLIGLVLALIGVIVFQWLGSVPVLGWITDIAAGGLFFLSLGLGFLMALGLVGYAFGQHLMYPALSSEGSDAFDAISRSYSYVFARPWRLLGYGLVSLVYGAVTYLFVGVMIFLTLYLTQMAVGCFDGWMSINRFELMMPEPRFGELAMQSDLESLNWSGMVATFLVRVWVYLAIGLVFAYGISYYFAATSTIYLLLRRRCDGTDMGQCFIEPDDRPAPAPAPAESPAAEPTPDAKPDQPGPANPEPADET